METQKTIEKGRNLFIWSLVAITILLNFESYSQRTISATLKTDKTIYTVGETVQISGENWTPGEIVILQVEAETRTIETASYSPWEVTADDDGKIASTWLVTGAEVGVELSLTADGKQSGFMITIDFIDQISTKIHTHMSSYEFTSGTTLTASANLYYYDLPFSKSISDRTLLFYHGDQFLGSAITNNYGRAELNVSITGSPGCYYDENRILVRFVGDESFAASESGPFRYCILNQYPNPIGIIGPQQVLAGSTNVKYELPDIGAYKYHWYLYNYSTARINPVEGIFSSIIPDPVIGSRISEVTFGNDSERIFVKAFFTNGLIEEYYIDVEVLKAPPSLSIYDIVRSVQSETLYNSCSGYTDYYFYKPAYPPMTYVFSGATIGNGSGTGTEQLFNLGETIVTVTSTNDFGSSSLTFNVLVFDKTKPVIKCIDATGVSSANDKGDCTGVANLIIPEATDNCTLASLKSYISGREIDIQNYDFDIGTTKVTWIATDNSGNTAENYQFITIIDDENPTVTCIEIEPVPTSTDGRGDCVTTISIKPPKATDNCGIESIKAYVNRQEIDLTTFKFNTGDTEIEWIATDKSGNTSSYKQVIQVYDDELPQISCSNVITTTSSDGRGSCWTTAALSTPVATDNCDIVSVKAFIAGQEIEPGSHFFEVGITNVEWVVTDGNGNTAGCTQQVTVTDDEEPGISCPSSEIKGYADPGDGKTTVQLDAAAWDNCGSATLSYYIGAVKIDENYRFPLGVTKVKAVALDVSGNTNECEFNVNIIGKVCMNYSGVLMASSTSAQVKVVLAVTLSGLNNTPVTGLTVDFKIQGSSVPLNPTPISVGLVNKSDNTVGTAVYEWITNMPSAGFATYNISAEVHGNPAVKDNSCSDATGIPVNIYTPQNEFITGVGNILLSNPAGVSAGNVGSKSHFAFNVKWNKSNKNLQGNYNMVFQRTETDGLVHTWQVKTNSLSSLSVNSANTPGTAVFTGKASIQDISEYPVIPLRGDGNAILQTEISDVADPGDMLDLLAVTVWNKDGGIWFSNSWNGIKTIKQVIEKGNIQIKKGNTVKSGTIETNNTESIVSAENVKVYPNPFTSVLKFDLNWPKDTHAILDLIDIRGAKVATIFNGQLRAGQDLHIEWLPKSVMQTGIYFYHLSIDNQQIKGKVLYKP